MGGRGARSGISEKGVPYGTEYTTLYQSGNIKFVRYNISKATTPPYDTMTSGRVYVTVNNGDRLKSIIYFDKNNKRYKQVDLDHIHRINGKREIQHTHKGYEHNESKAFVLSEKEKKMVDRVVKTWYNHLNGK